MSDETFRITPDVASTGYLPAACPECHRQRLELYADEAAERAVGVRCERCGNTWLLDPRVGHRHYAGDYAEHDVLRDGGEVEL